MKKILMVCSCLVLLLALSVPTFAADEYTLSGKWYIDNKYGIEGYSVSYANGAVNGYYYSSYSNKNINFDHLTSSGGKSSSIYAWVVNTSGYSNGTEVGLFDKNSADSVFSDYFDFGSTPQTVSASLYALIDSVASSRICDGSSCPATDINQDNICDDCGGAFTFNLRNDTYSFNGHYLPASIKDESGALVNLINYWHDTLRPNGGNLVLLNGDNADSALLYYFTPNVEYRSGNVVTTGNTSVTLYKVDTDDNGNPYWYKSATDTWNTDGALVASESHIDWVAEAVPNEEGIYQITGDVNFMTPLWEKVGTATQGEMTPMSQKIVGTMKILVACSVGLMACLVVLSLFGKRSLIFRS